LDKERSRAVEACNELDHGISVQSQAHDLLCLSEFPLTERIDKKSDCFHGVVQVVMQQMQFRKFLGLGTREETHFVVGGG
jgi:hypothetical protein